jgi:ribosome-associated protein
MRDLDLGDGTIVPAELLRATTSRSGGPGGQNVNKVESRVTIEVSVDALPLEDEKKARIREKLASRINKDGVLRVTSQSARSQLANRDHALERLEALLRDALKEQKPRKKTRVSRVAKQKRVDEKKKLGDKKRLRGKFRGES